MTQKTQHHLRPLFKNYTDSKIAKISQIPKGLINKSYIITTKDKKKYVIKIYKTKKFEPAHIENITNIIQLTINSPVPEFLKGNNSKFTQIHKNYFSTLSVYHPPGPQPELSLKTAKLTAIALGNFHEELKHLTSEKIETLNFQKTIQKLSTKKYSSYTNMLLKNLNKKFKNQIIHGDFGPNNLDYSEKKVTRIYDFDKLAIAPKEFDMAVSLHRLIRDIKLPNKKIITSFLENYNKNISAKDVFLFLKYYNFYRLRRAQTFYKKIDSPQEFEKLKQEIHKLEKLI